LAIHLEDDYGAGLGYGLKLSELIQIHRSNLVAPTAC
jgi:hypothetical protein